MGDDAQNAGLFAPSNVANRAPYNVMLRSINA